MISSGVPPDPTLVDICLMDGESGITIAQKLFHHFGIRTLFVTDDSDQCDPRAMQAYDVRCLHKPYDEHDILAASDVAGEVVSGITRRRIPAPLEVYQ